MEMESNVAAADAVAVEFEKESREGGMNDENRSCSPTRCVARISRRVRFDKKNSFERNSDSVRIGRGEGDVLSADSSSAGFEREFPVIGSYSSMPRDCWDNGRRRRAVELEKPSNSVDEDALRRTSSCSVHDSAPGVDQNPSMSACASMDRIVVELVQVLSPVRCFHIRQHSVNASQGSP